MIKGNKAGCWQVKWNREEVLRADSWGLGVEESPSLTMEAKHYCQRIPHISNWCITMAQGVCERSPVNHSALPE